MGWRFVSGSEGHYIDLGQHVLQAGRADGTATDGATFLPRDASPRFWGYLEDHPRTWIRG